MPPDADPSNAVLAEMIESLEDKLRQRDDDETRFHVRMETKMDGLSASVVTIQVNAAVQDAKHEAKIEALATRLNTHESGHREAEKSARFHTGAMIAALTAIGTVATAAIAIAVALH